MQTDCISRDEWSAVYGCWLALVHTAAAQSSGAADVDGGVAAAPSTMPDAAAAARRECAAKALSDIGEYVDMGLRRSFSATTLRNAWIVKPNHLSKGSGASGLCAHR
jgi:hypothetical protein